MDGLVLSRVLRVTATALTVAVLGACVAPFDASVTARVTDATAPALEVFSPVDGEVYGEIVTVSGRARDEESEEHQPVEVTYEVFGPLGTLRTGTVPALHGDGTFSFSFETLLIDGPISVAVTATDWNGNAARLVVSLLAPVSRLPSFSAVAGNEQIEVSWAPVPGASEYTLRYTDNGSLPSDSFGAVQTFTSAPLIDDPHVIPNARNGRLYVFRLEATVGDDVFTSSFRAVVPLSPLTLAPKVSGGYRKIELEWPEIPAVETFEVWRSQSRDSRYINYSGTVTGNRFVDPGVSVGEVYYYRVRPVLEGAVLSDPNSGVAHPFPDTEQDRRSGALLPGTASRIATVGEVALVAAGAEGLHIVDISEPDQPRLRATYARPDINVVDVAARGDYAVVSDAGSAGSSSDGEVLILDIASPSRPSLVASVAVAAPGRLALTEDYIIVADGKAQVRIIAATDLSAPGTVWSYTPPNARVHAIAAVGGSGLYHYVYIVDQADFDDPNYGYTYRVRLGSQRYFTTPSPTLLRDYTHTEFIPLEVAATPSHVYTMSMEPFSVGLFYYTIEALASGTMARVGRDPSTHLVGDSSRSDILVRGRRLFVANNVGIRMWNISDPAEPVSIGYWNTPGPARGVALGERHVFAAAGDLGVQGVDLTAPGRFQERFTFPEPANAVAVDGTTAYLATTSGSLVSLSLTGTAPAMRGSIDLGAAHAVQVSGNYAFVATGTNGIAVVDITDPASMILAGTASQTGSTRDLSVFGDYVYVASGVGLQVFRVSDPTSPEFVGFFDSRYSINRVEVRGRIAYVTESSYLLSSALYLIDVSRPEAPILIEEWPVGIMVNDLTIRDGYAFISDAVPGGGLAVVDVDPVRATYGTTVSQIEVPGVNEAIAAITNYVVLGGSVFGQRMVSLVDTTNPASLDETSIIDHYDAADSANVGDVVFWSKYLLVADRDTGLTVLDALPGF